MDNDMINDKPVKMKRHMFLWVCLIALGLMLFGQILGSLLCSSIALAFSGMEAKWNFLLLYLSFIGIDLLTLLYCRLAEKDIFRSFRSAKRGGGAGNTLREFGLGVAIGFVMNGVCILLAWLHGDLDFSVGRFEPFYLLAAFLCVMVQSGAEEILTRGYILGALRERYGVWIAVAVNSLFFGSLHLFNTGITVLSMLNIILIGVALSFAVCFRGSLWMAIAVHTMWNFTQNFLFGLPNSGIVSRGSFLHLEAAGNSAFYDAVFGIEGTITAVLVELLLCLFLWLRWKKTNTSA